MNSRSPFHRSATLVAGVLLGLAGALATTTSASAHTGELTAVSQCTDTGWTATWNLTTADTDNHEGVLSNVTLNLSYTEVPPGSGGPPRLDRLIDGAKVTGDTTVTDTKKLSPYVTSAALNLTVTWKVGDDLHTKTLHAQTDAPTNCNWPPKPEPSRLSTSFDCATMTITLVNPASAVQEVAFRLKSSEGEERTLAAKPGESYTATLRITFTDETAAGEQGTLYNIGYTYFGYPIAVDGEAYTVTAAGGR